VNIFLAGASGVIGVRLLPLLVADGHRVTGLTRSPGKADALHALGAVPVVCDVFDAEALCVVVKDARPDLLMSQITDLPDDVTAIVEFGVANARIRRDGTRNLLNAAAAAGVDRFIAQSVAWTIAGNGGAAVEDMERMVLDAGGTIVRYGQFYGPGTYYDTAPPTGPTIHIDDAARRTLEALDTTAAILTFVD
jgi:nucleoside-diphosphate-sugar epimerase